LNVSAAEFIKKGHYCLFITVHLFDDFGTESARSWSWGILIEKDSTNFTSYFQQMLGARNRSRGGFQFKVKLAFFSIATVTTIESKCPAFIGRKEPFLSTQKHDEFGWHRRE
jgi:hypothetical protein